MMVHSNNAWETKNDAPFKSPTFRQPTWPAPTFFWRGLCHPITSLHLLLVFTTTTNIETANPDEHLVINQRIGKIEIVTSKKEKKMNHQITFKLLQFPRQTFQYIVCCWLTSPLVSGVHFLPGCVSRSCDCLFDLVQSSGPPVCFVCVLPCVVARSSSYIITSVTAFIPRVNLPCFFVFWLGLSPQPFLNLSAFFYMYWPAFFLLNKTLLFELQHLSWAFESKLCDPVHVNTHIKLVTMRRERRSWEIDQMY